MPRYALTVAYDGTNFCGWQKQEPPPRPQQEGTSATESTRRFEEMVLAQSEWDDVPEGRVALRTVQAVLERAVREVVREPVIVTGASRTDAGVHARGQVAAFTCSEGAWPIARGVMPLLRAINSRLPEDVLVVRAGGVDEGFDPVRGATSKRYEYTVRQSEHRALFDRGFAHTVHDALDVGAMRRAASHALGTHDCLGLTTVHHGRLTTERTIHACDVTLLREREPADDGMIDDAGRVVRIGVEGSGFLYNMVRIMAGTLVEVGRGRLPEDAFARIYASKDRRMAGPTLPARGLMLRWIHYGNMTGEAGSRIGPDA